MFAHKTNSVKVVHTVYTYTTQHTYYTVGICNKIIRLRRSATTTKEISNLNIDIMGRYFYPKI